MTKIKRGVYAQRVAGERDIRVIRDCSSLWRWEIANRFGAVYRRGREMLPTKTQALQAALVVSQEPIA